MTKTNSQYQPTQSEDDMDKADETVYLLAYWEYLV
jgi:hypothetical protein